MHLITFLIFWVISVRRALYDSSHGDFYSQNSIISKDFSNIIILSL